MIGIDIDKPERFSQDDQFLNRLFYQEEIAHIKKSFCQSLCQQRIASLFSAKEAVMKALGLGKNSGVSFKDIQILHDESGKPYVVLNGKAKEQMEERYKGKHIEISLSHTPETVVAVAVIV